MAAATLVDTNVLLDVLTEDPVWLEWSADALGAAAESGPLWINPIIDAEVSVRFPRIEDLEGALPSQDYRRAQLPWEAAFLAGKAFVQYRHNMWDEDVDAAGLLRRCTRRHRRGHPAHPRQQPI